MKRLRQVTVTFLLIVFSVWLTACGGGGGDSNVTDTGDPPATPDESSTSRGLIMDALNSGEISVEESLIYKMFAAYSIDRLPAEYQGDDSMVRDSRIHREVAAVMDQLSVETQQTLWPFMIPAYYEGSWHTLKTKAKTRASTPCHPWIAVCNLDSSWLYVDGTNVRAWYHNSHPEDLATAQQIVAVMDNKIWPQLVALMDNKAPLSDAGLSYDGGDGRYDIALVEISDYGAAFAVDPAATGCGPTATHIEVRRGLSTADLEATLAHEFMHSIQWMYPSSCWYESYAWMDEASATWAEHYMFTYDTEQMYASAFLDVPEKSLDWIDANGTHEYGAYLFFFYLHETFNENWIPAIYQAATTSDSLKTLNDGLMAAGSTNLAQQWPEFAKYNFNQVPVDEYNNWDGISEHAELSSDIMEPTLAGSTDGYLSMSVSLPHLSAQYYHVMFTDDKVRMVMLVNGLEFDVADAASPEGIDYYNTASRPAAETEGAHVEILYRVRGHDWQSIDVTGEALSGFCRDRTDGRVDEMVVIFSNSDFKQPNRVLRPTGYEPFLFFSNAACNKWDGSVTMTNTWDCGSEVMTADVSMEGFLHGFMKVTPEPMYSEEIAISQFEPVDGTLSWSMQGSDCGSCTVSSNDEWLLPITGADYLNVFDFVSSGPYDRRIDIGGFAQDEELTVTENWICAEPDMNEDFVRPLDFNIFTDFIDHSLKLSADGTRISGDITDEGGYVIHVDLTSVRQ